MKKTSRNEIRNTHWLIRFALSTVMLASAFATNAPASAAPSSGCVSNTDNAGAGSLRQCIIDADASGATTTITFDSLFDTPQTIVLASTLEIGRNIIIARPITSPLTLSGNHEVRVMRVLSTTTFENIVITHGDARLLFRASSALTDPGFNGAGIYNEGNLTLRSVSVISNSAGNFGGGIYNAGDLTVDSSTFDDNRSSNGEGNYGGAIYNTNTLTVTSSTFTSNFATNEGGAIYNDYSPASVFLSDTLIFSNFAGAGGGILTFGPVVIENSQLRGNSIDALGGGGTGGGGAIWSQTFLSIRNSVFATNTSIYGAVYNAGEGGVLYVTGTTFISNSATYGAGIYSNGNDTHVADSVFEGNTAISGGALFSQWGSHTVLDSQFVGNSVTGEGAAGGAIHQDSGQVVIERTSFRDNVSSQGAGGAISAQKFADGRPSASASRASDIVDSALFVRDSEFVNNRVTFGNGGAIVQSNSGIDAIPVSITGTTFYSNTATNGGAIATDNSLISIEIANSTFHNNTAFSNPTRPCIGQCRAASGSGDGGALYLNGPSFVTNTTIYSNSASGSGDGVFMTPPLLPRSSAGSDFVFVNTIFAGTGSAQCGGEGTITGTANIATDSSCGNAAEYASVGIGNFDNYGGFASTLPLLPGSPALNAGDDAACSTADQRGIARVDVCDVGAFESRGFSFGIVSGSPQSTSIGTNFAQPLVVAYTSSYSEPVGPGGPITLTAPNSGASISPNTQITGVVDASGRLTTTLTANDIGGTYAVTVAAQSVATPVIASLTNNAPPDDTSLVNLEIDPGTLAPTFISSTKGYSAGVVPYVVASATVTATTSDEGAYVVYSAAPGSCTNPILAKGLSQVSAPCTLEVGLNVITATVNSGDLPASVSVYTITITREPEILSDDTSLVNLEIDPGTLAPTFISSTKGYTAGVVPYVVASATVTATTSDEGAYVVYSAAPGLCTNPENKGLSQASAPCTLEVGLNVITATVNSGDLPASTGVYTITITRAAPEITLVLGNMWPKTGVPTGLMPVSLLGEGFLNVLTVTVDITAVKRFTIVNDNRIDFVMLPGTAGQKVDVKVESADASALAQQIFTYLDTSSGSVGAGGGTITTSSGVTLVVAGLGGSFVLTFTPTTPPQQFIGNLLMYSFQLEALLNGDSIPTISNPVTITLSVNPADVPVGETPYLYEYVPPSTSNRVGGESRALDAAPGEWQFVPGQAYDAVNGVVTAPLYRMSSYTLSTLKLRTWWFPNVGGHFGHSIVPLDGR